MRDLPINTTHPIYDLHADKWQRCRDCYEGEDAVKDRGAEYLPLLSDQANPEYVAYKRRALFYEALGRTIDGFVGAIARKESRVTAPAKLDLILEDITGGGVDLTEFIKKASTETLLQGRGGILVDYDQATARPYLTLYQAECITWWGVGKIVLRENVYVPKPTDPYKLEAVEQYRELNLENGVYIVRIWRQPKNEGVTGAWAVFEEITPNIKGVAINELPFFWLTPRGNTADIERPPLLGLVNVALSHYRSSADLEHGRHWAGLPLLWVSGVDDTGPPIRIGGSAVLRLPEASSKCAYAEFTGQGLGSLEKALAEKEHMMAVLGAAIIGDWRKGVEAAETARIRSSGEHSLLIAVISAVEKVMEQALEFCARWMGLNEAVEIEVNRDFIETPIAPQTIIALLEALQNGAISIDTFLYNLQQGEILDPNRTVADELASLPKPDAWLKPVPAPAAVLNPTSSVAKS